MRMTMSLPASVEQDLEALQVQIKECETTLTLHQSSPELVNQIALADNTVQLGKLRALNSAYENLALEEPNLFVHDSPIPSLLALRSTSTYVRESQVCVQTSEFKMREFQQRTEMERKDLDIAMSIRHALNNRLSLLFGRRKARSRKAVASAVSDTLGAFRMHRDYFATETVMLIKTFNCFIDEHLSIMLAAEEMGRHVVGDQLNCTEEKALGLIDLDERLGKPADTTSRAVTRQIRMDEVWSSLPVRGLPSEESLGQERAVAASMRELTEQLLNNLVEMESPDSHVLSAYTEVRSDSAVARFLVRSKVAHFHPGNARKLRLYSFAEGFS